VRVGDKIAVMTPQGNLTPAGMMPRIKQFTLVGLFNTGSYAFDANVGLIVLKDAQVLFRLQDAVSGVRLKLDDPFLAPVVKTQLQQSVFPEANFYLSDWTDKNQEYFNAVKMEKTMLFLILSIIIFVAACNLISTLFMVIMQKQSDIAILRTLGASRGSIAKIFFVQGSASCFIGAIVGLALGLLVTYNLPFVLSTARLLTGQSLINGAVYGIDTLPYDIQWLDIVQIVGVSLLLSLTATLYPSYRAAKTQPAEALRYE
jgi:lipoprotein-releasing system permease protein